jgi:hypothetical protein
MKSEISMLEFQNLLAKGSIQRSYKDLLRYLMNLRTHLEKNYPDHTVSALYQGYMDMSYFTFTPPSLLSRKLKIAIVFIYDKFRFEVWLSAANKQVQAKYWEFLKQSEWQKYFLVPSIKKYDSILEYVLVEQPDFRDTASLTEKIIGSSIEFTNDIESHLPTLVSQ